MPWGDAMEIDRNRVSLGAVALLALSAVALSPAARADVTVNQDASMDVGPIKIDIATVELTTRDRQRRDSTTHCHGFLSLFCGNAQDAQIVRLDKQLEWRLDPKKKVYTERDFPTAAERAEAQQRLEQALEQMKNCRPAQSPQGQPTAQTGPDTSHCQLSAPTVAVQKTGEHATIAGHDAQKSTIVMSQTCTDQKTGDVCEIDYGFETWLTSDDIPGVAEQRAFEHDYLAAQGLDANNPQMRGAMQQFMAPYASTMRQLQVKASDLQGYPLRTTFYVAFGGPHCGSAQQAQQQQQASSARRRGGFGFGRLASDAVGGRLSGLFARHGADAATSADAGQIGANATAQAADAASSSGGNNGASSNAAGSSTSSPMARVFSMSVETRSIDTSPIAADQFELPAGWKLQQPTTPSSATQGPTCPAAQ